MTALAPPTVGLPSLLKAATVQADAPLGVGVIGCGNFARRQHLPNLMRMEGVRLKAACDLKRAALNQTLTLFGRLKTTSEARTILEDPEIGAVVIAVPDAGQASLAEAALRAGKDVFLEKPGGTDAREFSRLARAAQASGRLLAFGFNKRFAPAYVTAKRLLAGKAPPATMVLRMADDAWRWLEDGVDFLAHDACHLFDLAVWFSGSRIATVYACSPRRNEYVIHLRFSKGGAASIILSGELSMDFPKERIELYLERGAVVVDDFVELRTFGQTDVPERQTFPGYAAHPAEDPWVARMGDRGLEGLLEVRRDLWAQCGGYGPPVRANSPTVLPNFLRNQGWRECLAAFCECASGKVSPGAPVLAHVGDAAHALEVVIAVRRSLRSGGVEPVASCSTP